MERAKGSVTGNVVLECRNVGRTFKGYNGGPDNEVLRGVDFEVRENGAAIDPKLYYGFGIN